MAKIARLDQILLQLQLADAVQITQALRRQKTHGGRLGMNLVQLGVITEKQLVTALAEQFRLPTLEPKEDDISLSLVARMPGDLVALGTAVPLSWNEASRVLSLAVSCPDDIESMRRVKDAFKAKAIRVALAPESLLATLGRSLAPRKEATDEGGTPSRIKLPELFAKEAEERAAPEPVKGDAPLERVVMITAHPSRKTFLPPVFEREGISLAVASNREEAEDALRDPEVDRVLLSREMAEAYAGWLHDGMATPEAEVVAFSSVAEALLENPLNYAQTAGSLKSAVQALADYRSGEIGVSPAYGLVARDAQALAQRFGLRRVAGDALHLCVHLLLPARGAVADPVGGSEPFGAFASSLELATRLRFPWNLDMLLAACHRLYSGRTGPGERGELSHEAHIAAQVLAITWYRHNHVASLEGSDEERMLALRVALREMGGRLATAEIVEAYLALIAERGGVEEDVGDRQVLLVGDDRISRALSPALGRVGRETVTTEDLADAQTMAERRPPGAIVVDHTRFPAQVDKFAQVTKLGGGVLLFVLTDSTDPALVMNLLDAGVDDVFCPPHDFDLVAARINRAVRSRARVGAGERPQAGQFSASFDVFGFLDLVQMLSQGMKSVRIDLSNGDRKAAIFMQKGRMVDASAEGLSGPEAVYRVITWEDQGDFVVREESEFGPPTIHASTESILMDGLKLLDERKASRS